MRCAPESYILSALPGAKDASHAPKIETCALEECARQGKAVIGWDQKFGNPEWQIVPGKPHLRRGIGVALVMQGTAIPYLDMGGASIKMNDDGSFNLLVGATDLGTGSDTVLGQMAAENLGVPLDDILVYSSDTDFTPLTRAPMPQAPPTSQARRLHRPQHWWQIVSANVLRVC